MATRSWTFGVGWPRRNTNIVTLVRKDGMRIAVNRGCSELVKILMDLTELSGYDLRPGQCWGYANRPIGGTRSASGHSWGTDIDLNAPTNPHASAAWHRRNARGTRPFGLALSCDIPERVIRMWEDNGFTWGGRWSNPDPMHFEFRGNTGDAFIRTLALKKFLAG